MKEKYALVTTRGFDERARRLPRDVGRQLAARLKRLAVDPHDGPLKTKEVEGAAAERAEKVFETSVNGTCRLTWGFGPGKAEITLRNIDSL